MSTPASNLVYYCYRGNGVEVRKLIANKADLNVTFNDVCPLMAAIHANNPELVSLLLQYRANPDSIAPEKCSALHYACCHGNFNAMKALLSHGSNVTARDIVKAASYGYRDGVASLIKRYNEEIFTTVLSRLPDLLKMSGGPTENTHDKKIVDFLIDVCHDEINQGTYRAIPLAYTLHADSAYMCSSLIMAGATVPDEYVVPALILLLNNSYNPAAHKLLAMNPETLLHKTNTLGCTVLHAAAGAKFVGASPDTEELVSFLLKAGANPNIPDNLGRTPLFFASNADIAKKLLDAGADINHLDNKGRVAALCTGIKVATALFA
jgi:hypothetical protein